jgi:alkylation response protein AidB-like acyl-CoA dehydrogenase
LPKIAAGELIICVAASEKAGQHLLQANNCKVSNNTLSGKKIAVLDGISADYAIVSACNDGDTECSLYLVDLNQDGVTRSSAASIDTSRPLATLNFNNAACELLGSEKQATRILSQAFDRAAVYTSFEQLGGCEAAMQMGMTYTKQRFAFGRAVASFQAIKHIFADMYVAIELARSNAYYAAWALSADDDELALAAATARVSASDAYYFCSKENIEAHGGMGFTWEFDCHLYYKRAQLLSSVIGGSRWWREQLVNKLLAK